MKLSSELQPYLESVLPLIMTYFNTEVLQVKNRLRKGYTHCLPVQVNPNFLHNRQEMPVPHLITPPQLVLSLDQFPTSPFKRLRGYRHFRFFTGSAEVTS